MANTIKIMIQFNGKNLTLPINPEKLSISNSASNTNIDIIGLGSATRKGNPGLKTFSIDSFFPNPNSFFYTGVYPKTCIEFIEEIWNTENVNNNVAKIVTIGLPVNVDMYFVIESFTYDHRAGEEDDIYYNLKIKQYIPYGAKTVQTNLTGLAAARASSSVSKPAANQAKASTRNTYTVQKGDCLWNITKNACGNGSKWQELYNLNKSVIGSNPNLIKPGQVLTLPNGWSIKGSVNKLKNVTSSKSTSAKSTTSTKSTTANKTTVATTTKLVDSKQTKVNEINNYNVADKYKGMSIGLANKYTGMSLSPNSVKRLNLTKAGIGG